MPTFCRAGVDFGTTFSTISAFVDEVATPLFLEGSPFIPTVITFFDNKVVIGELAKTISEVVKDNVTYFDLKRWVGVNEKNFIKLKEKLQPSYECKLEKGECYMGGIGVRTVFRSVGFLIATYLDVLTKLFEEKYDVKITNLNVSVPADFYTFQRSYMRNAVNNLGIKVDRMINEPSAAALHSILSNPEFTDFVIFDFGGGTFDVSYIKKKGKIIMICDTQGDLFLGGRDIDKSIQHYFFGKYSIEIHPFSLSYMKEGVSTGKSQSFNVLSSNKEINHVNFSKDELNSIVSPFAKRSCEILKAVIDRNEITNAVICMVGGSSLLTEVYNQVNNVAKGTNNKIFRDENLRLSVSFGCSCLHFFTDDPDFTYIDVNSHCVFEIDEMFKPSVLIRKPMPIPYTLRQEKQNNNKFLTAVDIYEGDSQWFLDCQVLIKDVYSTDAVSSLGSGYYRVIQYDLDGNINVWIENKDSTNKRNLKSLITSHKTIKLENFERVQTGSSSLYCTVAELIKYHKLDKNIEAIDSNLFFKIKDYIEINGGISKYIETLRKNGVQI
ncbi:HSP70h [Cordyline virus 1]|uniref:HSP70h n=1 Tax=Cordyline virus 1 TaxID=937809 RepID=E7CT65_9CLOS|nr:HSP70h [Cordyline virus 1]ADU03657.1 HSP70h [Cordyline virus 1]